MAKLSGIRKAVGAALAEKVNVARDGGKLRQTFEPDAVCYYFHQTANLKDQLRGLLPALYEDFQPIGTEPFRWDISGG